MEKYQNMRYNQFNSMEIKIPKEIEGVAQKLIDAGFLAYIVGGSIRDVLSKRTPKDWDITTNAKPDQIIDLYEKTFYANDFGTVTVVLESVEDESLKNIEITPFRTESKYSDRRHPDSVTFADTVEEDLSRRDFTINAIAYEISKRQLVDPYKGQIDIKDKVIRAVGDPNTRLQEDSLRILRAIRLSTELSFEIEESLLNALKENASLLSEISIERIRDEFSRIIMSDEPMKGLELSRETQVLELIIPELLEGIGVEQNEAHSFNVWEHSMRTLQHAAKKKWSFHVRLAALLHDVAKPKTREWSDKKDNWTFYAHDVVGARMTKKILVRMKFSRETIEVVTKLVRYHLFFSDVDVITMSAVRRIVVKVGRDNVWDLMKVRACDRIGTGRPKEAPYRLRKYESMIEEALRDPITVGMLKIDGAKIMDVTREKPGRRIGSILHALLEEVLDDPTKNESNVLEKRAKELSDMKSEELLKLGEKGREKQESIEEEAVKEIRKKHWVE